LTTRAFWARPNEQVKEDVMEREIPKQTGEKLLARAPLPVDPARAIAIKRDVHEFEVDVEAQAFARAFREVMTDPESTFGLIRVKRPRERLGRDFEVGERFQGCFSLEMALSGWVERGPLRPLAGAVRGLLARGAVARAIALVEDRLLSDHAEIEELSLDEAGHARLRYRYLEGTPIAGSSTFVVEPEGAGRCRVRQIFEYQEVNAIALATFQRFGLKYHDQVVHMQVQQAAARAGARAVRGTIPDHYARM
jgi:hypothetical protein